MSGYCRSPKKLMLTKDEIGLISLTLYPAVGLDLKSTLHSPQKPQSVKL